MSEENNTPEIDWYVLQERDFLRITITGNFKEKEALKISESLKKELSSHTGKQINIIWNCLKMTGYEPMSRTIIQNTIKEFKDKIRNNFLLTENKVIQAGGMIISVFISFEMKIVKSEDEIIKYLLKKEKHNG